MSALGEISMPAITELALEDSHPSGLLGLLKWIHLPNLKSLSLNLTTVYSSFDDYLLPLLTEECPETHRIILPLTQVKILRLLYLPTASPNGVGKILDMLSDLEDLTVDFSQPSMMSWYSSLCRPVLPAAEGKVYCPRLEVMHFFGLEVRKVRELAEEREKRGRPLKEVYVDCKRMRRTDWEWLSTHLEVFKITGYNEWGYPSLDDAYLYVLQEEYDHEPQGIV